MKREYLTLFAERPKASFRGNCFLRRVKGRLGDLEMLTILGSIRKEPLLDPVMAFS